ncbi:hypothetical protein PR048_020700 [Dryococelus australis]|uniref:Mutator-like transposase domain-containing protein n=1 Tax=Dryococelus australis TaxID=614101 RepID=A0ABQ9H743_9NEOP|nr:hypothetical protein PR048_020700 [Dryococelus australis]
MWGKQDCFETSSVFKDVAQLPEAASKPLKATIGKPPKKSVLSGKIDSNFYTMADCSELSCVDEPPSKQDITTPNSKTIHGEPIEGRHIFYGNHLFTEIRRLCNHNKIFECDFSRMKVINEHRKGMASTFLIECYMCSLKDKICIESPKTNRESMGIIDAWVNSMLLTGQGFSQLRDITVSLEI